jgi:hypothetical protein
MNLERPSNKKPLNSISSANALDSAKRSPKITKTDNGISGIIEKKTDKSGSIKVTQHTSPIKDISIIKGRRNKDNESFVKWDRYSGNPSLFLNIPVSVKNVRKGIIDRTPGKLRLVVRA